MSNEGFSSAKNQLLLLLFEGHTQYMFVESGDFNFSVIFGHW